MANLSRMSGTPWHVEKYTRKDGDERRHRSRCKYYSKYNSFCKKEVGKCRGASHCRYYDEIIRDNTENKNLQVKETTGETISQEVLDWFDVGKKVIHPKFGLGWITLRDGNKIAVDFLDQDKEITLDLKICIKNKLLKKVFE